jgi:hypothetical protein
MRRVSEWHCCTYMHGFHFRFDAHVHMQAHCSLVLKVIPLEEDARSLAWFGLG